MCARPRSVSDEEIFAATASLVARHGPGQLTVAAVAEEAGMAASSLMQRFGSKRDLLLAFASKAADAVTALFDRERARHPRPLDALQAALLAMAAHSRTRKEMANNLAFLQMDLSDPEFGKHAAAHGRAVRAEIERLLRDAGMTRDAAARARDVQVVFNGALITWAIHGEGTLAEAVKGALRIALRRERRPERRSA